MVFSPVKQLQNPRPRLQNWGLTWRLNFGGQKQSTIRWDFMGFAYYRPAHGPSIFNLSNRSRFHSISQRFSLAFPETEEGKTLSTSKGRHYLTFLWELKQIHKLLLHTLRPQRWVVYAEKWKLVCRENKQDLMYWNLMRKFQCLKWRNIRCWSRFLPLILIQLMLSEDRENPTLPILVFWYVNISFAVCFIEVISRRHSIYRAWDFGLFLLFCCNWIESGLLFVIIIITNCYLLDLLELLSINLGTMWDTVLLQMFQHFDIWFGFLFYSLAIN